MSYETPDQVSASTAILSADAKTLPKLGYVPDSFVFFGMRPQDSPQITVENNPKTYNWTFSASRTDFRSSEITAQAFRVQSGGYDHLFNGGRIPLRTLDWFFCIQIRVPVGAEATINVPLWVGHDSALKSNSLFFGSPGLVVQEGQTSAYLPIFDNSGMLAQILHVTQDRNGTLKLDVQTSNFFRTYNKQRWLGALRFDTPAGPKIGSISLPGTHASGAIENEFSPNTFTTQYSTIKGQLDAGIRLFDLRIGVANRSGPPELVMCNGSSESPSNAFYGFFETLTVLSEFLKNNPSEFIVASLKIDNWNGFDKSIQGYRAILEDLRSLLDAKYQFLIRSSDLPLASEARGKIYLLDRIQAFSVSGMKGEDTASAFGAALDIPEGTSGQLLPAVPGRNFSVYAQECRGTTAEKLKAFENALTAGADAEVIMNFASGATEYAAHFVTNGRLMQWLGENSSMFRPHRLGWSFFNFADTPFPTDIYQRISITDLMIASNTADGEHRWFTYDKPFKVDVFAG